MIKNSLNQPIKPSTFTFKNQLDNQGLRCAGRRRREREVSLESGRCVAEPCQKAGFYVVTSDIRPDDMRISIAGTSSGSSWALHGEFGEDGSSAGLRRPRSLQGSGPSQRLAFDQRWPE